jgi:hypothetical protein
MITLTTTLSRAGGVRFAQVTSGLLARLTNSGQGGVPPVGVGVFPWVVRLGEESPHIASSPLIHLGDF